MLNIDDKNVVNDIPKMDNLDVDDDVPFLKTLRKNHDRRQYF